MENKLELKNSFKKIFIACTLCIFAFVIAILIHHSFYITPNAEDLGITYDMLSHKNPLTTYYQTVDGRYFTNFLYRFGNPLIYNNIILYKSLPILFYFLWIFSTYQLARVTSVAKNLKITLSIFLVSVFIIFMPEISGGLFAMATLYNYGVMIFLIPLIISYSFQYATKRKKSHLITVAILLFLLSGTNEMGIFISGFMLLTILIDKYIQKNKIDFVFFGVIFLIICASIIALSAPGNYNRLGDEILNTSLNEQIKHIGNSYLNSFIAGTIKSIFIFSHPSLILIFYFWFRYSKYLFKTPNTYLKSLKTILPTYILFFLFINFTLPFPFYYSETWLWGYGTMYGMKNIDNPIFFILLFLHLFFINVISGHFNIPSQIEKILNKKSFNITLISTCLLLMFTSNTFFHKYIYDVNYNLLKKYHAENNILIKHIKDQLTTQTNPIEINRFSHRPKTIFTFGYVMDNQLIGVQEITNNGYDVLGIDIDGDSLKRNANFCKWLEQAILIESLFKYYNEKPISCKKEIENRAIVLEKTLPFISKTQHSVFNNKHFTCGISDILIRYNSCFNELKIYLFGFSFHKIKTDNFSFNIKIQVNSHNHFISKDFIMENPFTNSNMETITWKTEQNLNPILHKASRKNQIFVKISNP